MKHKNILPYDPGVIPTKPALKIGDQLEIIVKGYPPFKDTSKSIRNITHRYYDCFVKLRYEAVNVMAGA